MRQMIILRVRLKNGVVLAYEYHRTRQGFANRRADKRDLQGGKLPSRFVSQGCVSIPTREETVPID